MAGALLSRFRDFSRTLGLRRALLALPRWLARREFVVLLADLERTESPPPVETALAFSTVTESEVPLLIEMNPALAEDDVRRSLAAGHEWVLARIDGEPVHFRSYLSGRVELPYLGCALRLEPGDVLLGLVYTAPALRRRGLLAAAATWSQRHVRARGHRRMIALIARWNEAPLRTARQVGMEVVGRVAWRRLGPWSRHWAAGGVWFDAAGDLRLPPASGGPQAPLSRRAGRAAAR